MAGKKKPAPKAKAPWQLAEESMRRFDRLHTGDRMGRVTRASMNVEDPTATMTRKQAALYVAAKDAQSARTSAKLKRYQAEIVAALNRPEVSDPYEEAMRKMRQRAAKESMRQGQAFRRAERRGSPGSALEQLQMRTALSTKD